MDNYIGKHLLVDCYGCRPSSIDSSPDLLAAMIDAAEKIGMTLKENFCHESEDEVIISAYMLTRSFVMQPWIFTALMQI